MPRRFSTSEISAILETGNFDQLIGGVEDEHLECKSSPYQLDQDRGKMELAKDVSALANSDGGFILIGVTTETEPTANGDIIRRVGCVARNLIDLAQYANVIGEWIIPTVPGLDLRLVPRNTDPDRVIFSIVVPSSASENKPFLASKVVTETNRIVGSYLGYFERTRDSVPPIKPAELRERLKDGLRFTELNGRLESIEELVARTAVRQNPTPPIIEEAELRRRTSQARRELGYSSEPSCYLLAWPLQVTHISGLFESHDAPVVRLLEHPPQIRQAGFDISTHGPSTIIEAARRRCLRPSRRLLEIWRDGTLICVVPGDDNHLCWGMHSNDTSGWRINNIALAETILLFCDWSLRVFQHAVPPPTSFKVRVGLADMTGTGHPPFKLSPHRPSFMNIGVGDRSSPEGHTGLAVETDVTREGGQAGAIAYTLLADIYNWFTFDSAEMPYVDRTRQPPVIDLSEMP